MKRRFISSVAYTVLLMGLTLPALETESPCRGRGPAVVVEIETHSMRLCEKDTIVGEYRVALGRGGEDKTKEGDAKTPLGEYSLGTPRPSKRFGLFIPIGYPTAEQRKRGFTGGAIGIHGPDRRFKWLGDITTWVDWTEGCIALGTDDDTESVAQWVRDRGVRRIFIGLRQ